MNLTLNIAVHPAAMPGAPPRVEVAPATAARPSSIEIFTKLGAAGEDLAPDATGHVAFRHRATGKLFHVVPCEKVLQREAEKRAAAVRVFDRKDWLLAEADELELMRDRTRFNPACHQVLAGDIKPDWHWSRTPDASDPSGCAWYLGFYYGDSGIGNRGFLSGFVVAVAPAGQ